MNLGKNSLKEKLRGRGRHFPGGSVAKNLPAWHLRHGLDPGSGKIPQAKEQPSLCATSTEPVFQSPGATTTEAHVP